LHGQLLVFTTAAVKVAVQMQERMGLQTVGLAAQAITLLAV
jgi:hypothetical protein